jgi:hypothetical protein
MDMHKLREAEEAGLMQLTIWSQDRPKERDILQRAMDQVLINKGRKAMAVKKGGLIALFVNEVGNRRK